MPDTGEPTIFDWIVELDSGEPTRRARAVEALKLLAPTSARAREALRGAGVATAQAGPAPERSAARRLYVISLFMPLAAISAVCFGPAAVLYPILLLLLVIVGFRTPSRFVFWHTNQWLLITMPAVAVAVAIPFATRGSFIGYGLDFMLVLAWYAANVFGLRQANAGECLTWRFFDNDAPLPWLEQVETPAAPPVVVTAAPRVSPAARDSIKELWLAQFRSQIPAERQAALAQLEALGEVEVF